MSESDKMVLEVLEKLKKESRIIIDDLNENNNDLNILNHLFTISTGYGFSEIEIYLSKINKTLKLEHRKNDAGEYARLDLCNNENPNRNIHVSVTIRTYNIIFKELQKLVDEACDKFVMLKSKKEKKELLNSLKSFLEE